jgi:capsular exopolysaccharide synthesis family protein
MSYVSTGSRGSRGGSGEGLLRYVQIIREHLLLIVACTVVAVGVAVAYVKIAPKSYQAQSTLLVLPASTDDPVLADLPIIHQSADPTQDILTGASLVTTNEVAVAVRSALRLTTGPGALLGDVQANPIGETDLVAVQATASSPQLAQRLANAFAAQTIVTRTDAMHLELTSVISGLEIEVAALPQSQRYGVGTIGNQLLEARNLLHSNDPTIAIAAPASLPSGPSSPHSKLSIAAGLIGGLVIGIGAAFLLHVLDPRLRREEQLRDLLDIPALARIPREHRSAKRPLLPHEMSLAAREAHRTLRTTLTARGSTATARAFLITGSAPSEGKSTTAIGLAVALANGGGRVILIEADMRRPTFASLLSLDVRYGTEAVLIGEVDLEEALVPVRFEGTSLRVLAAQYAGSTMADRLSPRIAGKLIEDAKAISDFVVIDSPPLTAVIDALPLAQFADEVVIVARLGHSKIGKVVELADLLVQYGAAASGFVLVGEAPRRLSGGYYYAANSETNGRSRGGAPPAPPSRGAPVKRSADGIESVVQDPSD